MHANSGRFCLTSDLWTTRNKLVFFSLTVHYIDSNWNLNKRIITFKMLESPHMGYNIANLIGEKLQYWGISDKIFSTTLDNATNTDTAEMLKKIIKNKLTFTWYIILNMFLCTYFEYNYSIWFIKFIIIC